MASTESCPHCGREVARTDKVCPHCQRGLTGKAMLTPTIATRPTTVSAGAVLLILAAVVVAGVGALLVSNATSEVALIAWACLLAIFARIAQAGAHHREMLAAFKSNAG